MDVNPAAKMTPRIGGDRELCVQTFGALQSSEFVKKDHEQTGKNNIRTTGFHLQDLFN